MSPHLDCIPPPDDAADAEDVTDQDGRPDGADSAGSGRGSADSLLIQCTAMLM